jgi:DNA invertase Pin-like site-specific DNA recombinase
VSGLLIGYARVSTDEQDLTAQRDVLTTLGVAPERIYVDHGTMLVHPGVARSR